ncbi:MAG TPA: MTH1187 family thiamine-binding protein [Chlorobaculum parvum]|uniref:MTH1187 family thiamine-binding protein n=1 Tax=Chlorobaculum parvum TaxID=274539 RepID=A0A7C5HKH4_9CHLB|nr:MTH1187 family thiamine-binding protein [Chlorobaculum parvum]
MALLEISVIPLGAGSSGLSAWVAGLQRLLDESGLSFKLNDMGTIVEGSADELFAVARKLHEHCFSAEVSRVYTVMKIDDRRDKQVAIGDKVASVEAGKARPDK